MTREPKRLRDYIEHVLQAIERIERYSDHLTESAFMADEMAQDAVIRNLEIIGEASRNIAQRFPDFSAAHPQLPLSIAYEMRNALAHGYFKVDLEIVWRTVKHDLPGLRAQLQELARDLTRYEPGPS